MTTRMAMRYTGMKVLNNKVNQNSRPFSRRKAKKSALFSLRLKKSLQVFRPAALQIFCIVSKIRACATTRRMASVCDIQKLSSTVRKQSLSNPDSQTYCLFCSTGYLPSTVTMKASLSLSNSSWKTS